MQRQKFNISLIMKQIAYSFLALLLIAGLSSCGKSNGGQLVGVDNRPGWKKQINPYGMVYVPSGTTHIGQSDQDVFSTYTQRPKAITIRGFFIDDTEISNNEYRQFVNYVRDSVAHMILGDILEDDFGNESVDWDYDIDWQDETLDEMFFQGDMAIGTKRELDTRQFNYSWEWINWKKAASKSFQGVRSDLINRDEVNVFPDTLTWIRDFSYSYNEPFARNYFWHSAFDDYPVVGITWKQARAFCDWRTNLWNSGGGEQNTEVFRLPTEAEWEYAARGGHDLAPYPWGGYYVRNAKGCLLANFKPGRGNYVEDGGETTVPVTAYFPNDYGLYNMSGNVAEWTETAYYPQAYSHVHDSNPDIKYDAADDDPKALKRKVIRGGSWKDISYFLQTGTRHWEYQDTSKSYIGFRCALTFLGRSLNDFK